MMRYVKVVLFTLVVTVFCLGVSSINLASADDDFENHQNYYESHHDDESPYEEVAGLIGWGTVIFLGAAGAIFPIRRFTKMVITYFPKFKKSYVFMVKKLGKYHLFIGLFALLLGTVHGILLYVSEWKLDSEGVTGLIVLLAMVVASIVGMVLTNNRKMKSLRTAHVILVVVIVLAGMFHIVIS